MKELYVTPEIEIQSFKLSNQILTSGEEIPGVGGDDFDFFSSKSPIAVRGINGPGFGW